MDFITRKKLNIDIPRVYMTLENSNNNLTLIMIGELMCTSAPFSAPSKMENPDWATKRKQLQFKFLCHGICLSPIMNGEQEFACASALALACTLEQKHWRRQFQQHVALLWVYVTEETTENIFSFVFAKKEFDGLPVYAQQCRCSLGVELWLVATFQRF